MPSHIHILCGDATYNRGDRGNLSAQIDLLQGYFPDARITVDSRRPEVDQTWYGVEVAKRRLPLSAEQVKYLKQCDVVVWGGGALLADNASCVKIPYWVTVIGFIKWVLRKPVMAWAQGLVLTTAFGSLLARLALDWADLVTVRDQNSFRTLERIGATQPSYYLTADPAVLAQASSPEVGRRILLAEGVPMDDRPLFVITNTFCPFHYNPRDVLPYMISRPLGLYGQDREEKVDLLKKTLARLADLLIANYDCRMLFIPTYPAPWEEDLKHFQDTVHMMRSGGRVCCLKRDIYSPRDYLSMWHHFDLVITIPLHHSIFSTVMEVPCVNLYYEPKGRDFFAEIDAEDRLLDVELLFQEEGPELVAQVVDNALSNWGSMLGRMRPRFKLVQSRARRNADYLAMLMRERGLIELAG